MHGEFKVPGGKLVVVDLEIVDGHLADVRVAGDFFLEPDTALDTINAALTGLSVETDATAMAAIVRSALPEDAILLGFSPESVATAVRRALRRATDWRDYPWRLLRGPALPPATQLALDQVLAERVGEGLREPTLRIWQWSGPAVIIGSFQSVRNEVDLEQADRLGFEVVRRISGGVLHHVTMSYDIDAETMVRVLRIGREKLSDKGIASAVKRVDPLRSQTGLPREEIIDRMVDTFRQRHGLVDDVLLPEELAAAEALAVEKFSTQEWTNRVP